MAPVEKVRILIAVGHKLFQEGLRLILRDVDAFTVVGMVNNGAQVIDEISGLKPDIVILDTQFPEANAIEVINLVRKKNFDTRVIIITHNNDEQAIIKAIRAGAKGYLPQNTSVADIIKAIELVHKGDFWVHRRLVNQFINSDLMSDGVPENSMHAMLSELTKREKQVLRSLVKGATNKEIANELFISEKTVKSHLNQVFKKLNVSRRLEAILSAIKAGLK